MGHLTLVIGGASSGKSAYAESLAAATGAAVAYVATGAAGDAEMRARIDRHRARRPAEWTTLESPTLDRHDLAAIDPTWTVLVDNLTGHLTDALLAREEATLAAYDREGPAALEPLLAPLRELIALAHERTGETILTADELGLSIVPVTPLGRAFRDLGGLANQLVARAAQRAVLVVAGRALELPSAP